MIKKLILPPALLLASVAPAHAALVSALDDASFWSVLATDDAGPKGAEGSYDAGPGVDGEGTKAHGGQHYDNEFLLFNVTGNMLTLALQTGFNLSLSYGSNTTAYTPGDLALSFDGTSNGYEYAIDFGEVLNYLDGGALTWKSADAVGLYEVSEWTDGTRQYNINGVLGMLDGTKVGDVDLATSSEDYVEDGYNVRSYFNIMSFDLTDIGLTADNVSNMSAYWTMSCGNDVITGSIPEPSVLALFSLGLLGLGGGVAAKRRKKQS